MEKNLPTCRSIHFRDQWLCKFLRTKKSFLHEKSVQLPLGLFLTLDLLGSVIGEVSKMEENEIK